MALSRRFMFNDASWDGSCHSKEHFLQCVGFCIQVHNELRKQGGGLEVGMGFLQGKLGFADSVEKACRLLHEDQRRRLRVWLDREGPFWDRPQQHCADEYFECEGDLVTDTALAEAAHVLSQRGDVVVVSLSSSKFTADPLRIIWHDGPSGTLEFDIPNATTLERVAELLEGALPDLESYGALISWVQRDCSYLEVVRDDMLDQMGSTFIPAVVRRGRELFAALNEIAEALQTGAGDRYKALCQEWLTGTRFSDSSAAEKGDAEFRLRMRFKHPCTGDYLYCFWHGKVSTGVFRLHFEWPPPFLGRRLFVAYFGPKLTKK